ncbi:MAG: pilus assembly protein PilP [Cardiobacteriaceae bacterium]|nr:pilus assembly protein PilP [Cardiobacteriaceae bacterium]
MKSPVLNAPLNKICVGMAAFVFTTGFFGANPEAEVSQFIRQTKDQATASATLDLGPIPEPKVYVPYVYEAQKENPFALKSFVSDATVAPETDGADECNNDDCGDGAPIPHVPYFLEGYPLEELTFVGTVLGKNNRRIALIQTPDAGVVNAMQGEYMGKNNGLVVSIKTDHIVIREKQKVPRGWQNRMAILELFK